jgi:hypothetical protein
LKSTNYFTKWIEAVPTRQATDIVIIQFLESNILSRFGFLVKIIIDNATTLNSKMMDKFFNDCNITLGQSTAYYPHGNGLVESSNKSLARMIKKLLQENIKAWHKKLIYALWDDKITIKRSISTSSFQIVYGTYAVFPTSSGLPVMKLLQEQEVEPNDIQIRINQLIHVQQMREEVYKNKKLHQDTMERVFDKHTKVDDLVLKWDAGNEDKGKHGKFD